MEDCAAAAAAGGDALALNSAFLSEDRTQCCLIVRTTFHVTQFLGGAAGNIVAGYGFVKYFALFMLWCEGDNGNVKVGNRDDREAAAMTSVVPTTERSRSFDRATPV